MEQENQENQENNSPYETVDFSDVLEDNEETQVIQEERIEEEKLKKIPKVYRLIMKFSFGLVKTEKDAKMIAVLIIIITNIITFSLLLKDRASNETFSEEAIPAEMPADSI